MVKHLKLIAFIMVLSIFACGISLLPHSLGGIVHADATPTPPPTAYTLTITARSLTSVPVGGTGAKCYVNPPGQYSNYSTTFTELNGTQVTITALNPTPSPGFVYDVATFVRWEGEPFASPAPNPVTVIMDHNINLVACYNVVHYDLTKTPPPPTPTPTVVITPTPVPTTYTLNITCRSLTEYPATSVAFQLNPPNTSFSAPVNYSYNSGTQVGIQMILPADSSYYIYQFVRWEGDASGSSGNITVTMNNNKNLVAVFNVIQYNTPTPTPPVVTSSPTPEKLTSILSPIYATNSTEYTITPTSSGPIKVRLTDGAGNALAGKTINWSSPIGILHLTATSVTDASGFAATNGLIPTDAGVNSHIVITASFAGDSQYNGSSCGVNVYVFSPGMPTPSPTPTVIRTLTPTPTPVRWTPTPTPIWNTTPTPTPMVTATPVPTAGIIKIQFYNQNLSGTSNQVYGNFKLINTGTGAITLSTVKIRYFYTVDGAKTQNFYCDYSPIGSSNVTGTFVTMTAPKAGADTYLEVGFTSGAGSLAAGASIVIQTRFAKTDWSNYTQTNDYSFNSTATTYEDWIKVTGYVSGGLQWGMEP